jgi:hypothetical protein
MAEPLKRRTTRSRSHTLICDDCGKRPMAMESYWCKKCQDKRRKRDRV